MTADEVLARRRGHQSLHFEPGGFQVWRRFNPKDLSIGFNPEYVEERRHVGWTIRFREYSPGLVSSILMGMNFYFILRYTPLQQAIGQNIWVGALIIGGAFTAFLVFYIPVVKGRKRTASVRVT
jgi:hypothetical protein